MGIQVSSPVLGRIRGRVGNVVLSEWRHIGTARNLPSKGKKKALSPVRARNTKVFGMVNSFLRNASQVIKLGWQLPRNAPFTAYNSAVSYHLGAAVQTDRDNVVFDLAKLKLSMPVRQTQQLWNPVITADADYHIVLRWELTPDAEMETRSDDRVNLFCYDATLERFITHEVHVRRSDLIKREKVGKSYQDHELHFYVFVISEDGKRVSETDYLGMVKLRA